MKNHFTGFALFGVAFCLSGAPLAAQAATASEATQRTAEQQIRRLVEPLLDKYCPEQCRLLRVTSTVEVKTPEILQPGFEELDLSHTKNVELTPSSAQIKLLIDDQVGPVSRRKITELLQPFLDTFDYPVKIDVQLAHFPAPLGSQNKVTELREKLTHQFRGALEELFSQFCPDSCLMADLKLDTEVVNSEEAQYGQPGDFIQESGIALKIRDLSVSLLMDDILTPEEQKNVLEMAKLKTNQWKNVHLASKSMKFPHPTYMNQASTKAWSPETPGTAEAGRKLASTEASNETKESKQSAESKTQSEESKSASSATKNEENSNNSDRQDKSERYEKIERVESGDVVQAELKRFQLYALVFACGVISLLIFVAMSTLRSKSTVTTDGGNHRANGAGASPDSSNSSASESTDSTSQDQRTLVGMRYECERLMEELLAIFAQQPKVAKHVFTRVLTEEGTEVMAQYLALFGESVVMDMLKDPSLQSDLTELLEYFAKTPQDIKDDEKLDLLKRLHNRTVAGKLVVLGNRSSHLFDFLAEMDGLQILELVRTESVTVKAIALTQVDPQKRQALYTQLDEETRMKLLTELSRIDYLPRDYIFNVAQALKRKRRENPRLNTEALPGSEVLVGLLEKTGSEIQRSVLKQLEVTHPDSARTVKAKLVSLETLRFLRDGQLLEVILSLRHEELLQFLKGAPAEIRSVIFAKSPKELTVELEEELQSLQGITREAYQSTERKVLNRMKMMAQEGLINLMETNERLFADHFTLQDTNPGFIAPKGAGEVTTTVPNLKKVAGW
jgi:flagellar motor switch protein FliG